MSTPEQKRARYARLKSRHLCVRCSLVKVAAGRVRCAECLSKDKVTHLRFNAQFRQLPPPTKRTPEALYQEVKHERELVSWAWRNPA